MSPVVSHLLAAVGGAFVLFIVLLAWAYLRQWRDG